jgi:hypothetical protein
VDISEAIGKHSIRKLMRINGLEGERGPGAIAQPGLQKSLPAKVMQGPTGEPRYDRANREKFNLSPVILFLQT